MKDLRRQCRNGVGIYSDLGFFSVRFLAWETPGILKMPLLQHVQPLLGLLTLAVSLPTLLSQVSKRIMCFLSDQHLTICHKI